MPSGRLVGAAFALAMTSVASQAIAQTGATEASDHHRAGVAYAKAGKWEQAVREFEEAYKLDPTPLRLYDVAQVSLQAKQYVRARDAYAKVADNPALSADQQQRARGGLATAKANIGHVRVAVTGAKPSDVVTIDGVRIHADVLDVDPGKHTVRLVRDGETTDVTVDVARGAETTATIGEKSGESKEQKGAPAEPQVETSSGGVPAVAWIFAGVGAAALGVGIPLIVIGYNEYADIEKDPCARDQTCGGREDPARQKALVGDILVGVGIVSAAVAVYFFVTAGDKPSAPKAPASSAWPHFDVGAASGGGLIRVRGSF